MNPKSRLLVLYGPPILLGTINLTHPMVWGKDVYSQIVPHAHHWVHLHLLNLFLFAGIGFSAFLLTTGKKGIAATVSRFAIGLYVPLYLAFDSIAGISTGMLVMHAHHLPADQLNTAKEIIDSFWTSDLLQVLVPIASIAWIISLLAAIVAFTDPTRRKLIVMILAILFIVNGWARTNLFNTPDGGITLAWWLVTVGSALVLLAVGKPRVPSALLFLAASLFGAMHVPPTGPLGMLCFVGAVASLKMTGESVY